MKKVIFIAALFLPLSTALAFTDEKTFIQESFKLLENKIIDKSDVDLDSAIKDVNFYCWSRNFNKQIVFKELNDRIEAEIAHYTAKKNDKYDSADLKIALAFCSIGLASTIGAYKLYGYWNRPLNREFDTLCRQLKAIGVNVRETTLNYGTVEQHTVHVGVPFDLPSEQKLYVKESTAKLVALREKAHKSWDKILYVLTPSILIVPGIHFLHSGLNPKNTKYIERFTVLRTKLAEKLAH